MGKDTGIDFKHYIFMVLRYMALEYDLGGTEDRPVMLKLTPKSLDFINTQWMTCQPVPNTASELASKVKSKDDSWSL